MKIPETVKAISFDAGGTLISPRHSVGHVYAEIAARHGWKHLDPEKLNVAFHSAWNAKQDFDYSKEDWAKIVADTFSGLVEKPDDPVFFENLYRRFASPEVWEVHTDVLLTLEVLSQQKFHLIVISNWDDRLPRILDGLGLSHFFRAIIFSADVGHAKPDEKIFQHAARTLRMAPDEILHVGDLEEEDFEGARNSGWHSVLIDRERRTSGDHVVHSLLDLVAHDELPTIKCLSENSE